MRLFRINGSDVDIDNQTAIGVTIQSYDFKTPAIRKVNVTNSFTIPATVNNLAIIGNPHDSQSNSLTIYGTMLCDYWVDSFQLIKNAKVRVSEVSDRITLFVFQKDDVWDSMKMLMTSTFTAELLEYMQDEKALPSSTNFFADTELANFLADYANILASKQKGLILPMYFGNLYNYDPLGGTAYLENINNICLKYQDIGAAPAYGGHFGVYYKTIFEFIEYKYGVNFLTAGGQSIGNLWDDTYALDMYVPLREIDVKLHYTLGVHDGYYFDIVSGGNYLPETNMFDKGDKSLYDIVNAFMMHFNVIKDEINLNGSDVIKLARFDDIDTVADIVDFSGKLQGNSTFIPIADGFARENNIKYKEIYPEGNSLINSKQIACLNDNIDAKADILEIDAYIPNFIPITGGVVPNLSIKESFKTTTCFVNDGYTDDFIFITIKDNGVTKTAALNLPVPALYSLSGEYNFFATMMYTPKIYKIQKWLTLHDLVGWEFFKQRWIQELGASFFINKIEGFNPQKSNEPTTIEVIRISNKKPVDAELTDVFVDGVDDTFTDGQGDYFY